MPRVPSPTAMARPTRRPAPVTNAVRGVGPSFSAEGADDVIGERRAAGGKGNCAIRANAVDSALDTASVGLQGVIGGGERAVGITEEREREAELPRVARMAVGAGRIHAERLHVIPAKRLDLIAHGGELTVSARGVVPRIEERGDVTVREQIAQAIGCAVARRRLEVGRRRPDFQRYLAHATRSDVVRALTTASCRSSHANGTRILPIVRGPLTEPCQSEPPLGTMPR